MRVLRRFGAAVEFPDQQTCCGQPAFNSGFDDDARPLARRLIRVFEPYDHIVSPSASCVAMVKQHYPGLLADDEPWRRRAEELAGKTHEFTGFLRDVLGVDVASRLTCDEPLTYHYPCHARGIYPLDDLRAALGGAGVDLREPPQPDLCCGFGGLFALDQPEISGALLREKLDVLAASGAELVVCNEAGCALNLAGGARRHGVRLRFKHLAELLAESLGLLESNG